MGRHYIYHRMRLTRFLVLCVPLFALGLTRHTAHLCPRKTFALACVSAPLPLPVYGGFQHAGVLVEDVERSKQFYLEVFAFKDDTHLRPGARTVLLSLMPCVYGVRALPQPSFPTLELLCGSDRTRYTSCRCVSPEAHFLCARGTCSVIRVCVYVRMSVCAAA
jgi:hypothetical protein